MAPVMSSVTVACCVRSPSATVCSSFISRRMAAWLASLTRLASCSWRSASRRCASASLRCAVWSTHEQAQQADAADDDHRGQQRPQACAEAEAGLRRQLPCRPSRPVRSGSLSATIAACASRADTRPCRLPRMALACVRVSSYCLSSASGAPWSAVLVAGGRSSGLLPSDRPWRSRGTSSGPCRAGTPPRATPFHGQELVGRLCRCAASA